MAIPDYQAVMLPLLQFAGDGQEHSLRETIDALAEKFRLTPEERKQLLPSGQQEVFDNRVGWARTYLTKADLLRKTRRSHFAITERGRQVLSEDLPRLDVKYLEKFEEFRAFRALKKTRTDENKKTVQATLDEATPEESLELAYGRLRDTLASELLQQIKAAPPSLFE